MSCLSISTMTDYRIHSLLPSSSSRQVPPGVDLVASALSPAGRLAGLQATVNDRRTSSPLRYSRQTEGCSCAAALMSRHFEASLFFITA